MMLTIRWATIATALAFTTPGFAADISIDDCDKRNVALNQVQAMRPFANGSVKLFSIDQEEPAAVPAGIAVTIDRGDNLADAESFCRYVFGLSDVDLAKANAKFDQATAILSIDIAVRSHDPNTDNFVPGVLKLKINKSAKTPEALVSAALR